MLTGRWGFRRTRHPRLMKAYNSLHATLPRRLNTTLLQCTLPIAKRLVTFPDPRFLRIGGSPSTQQPGIQLLATSKDMYARGHTILYTQNRFHIAPGPIIVSSSYFTLLQPQHLQLIRSLVVTFSIADLTPEGFLRMHYYIAAYTQRIPTYSRDEQIALWTDCSMRALHSIWREKLSWLRKWPSLTDVTLAGGGISRQIPGPDFTAALDHVDAGDSKDHAWYFRKACADTARPLLLKLFARGRLVVEGGRIADGNAVALDQGDDDDDDDDEAEVATGDGPQGAVDVEAAKDWLNALGPGLRSLH